MTKKLFLLAFALFLGMQANAQLSNVLKNAASGLLSGAKSENSTVNGIVDVVGNLLGTNKVSSDHLVGTWSYSEPCVVFESDNILTQLGTSAVSGKAEKALGTQLSRIGFTAGKVALTLNADSTGHIAFNQKQVNVNWGVTDSTLTLTFPLTQKSVNMNVKLSGGDLQVAMNTDKMLTMVSALTSKASSIASLKTVGSLVDKIKGMYVGFKFKKE